MQSRTNSHWSCCLPKLIAVLVTAGKVQKNRRGFSGRCKGGPGENRNPLGLQIANRRSVCNLKRRKQAQRIRDVAPSGDSFRRGRFRRASGGPFFSALPEKNGEKRGAGLRFGACCGCSLGKPLFSVTANTHSHPTGTMVRAACYGASDLQVAAFERLR